MGWCHLLLVDFAVQTVDLAGIHLVAAVVATVVAGMMGRLQGKSGMARRMLADIVVGTSSVVVVAHMEPAVGNIQDAVGTVASAVVVGMDYTLAVAVVELQELLA